MIESSETLPADMMKLLVEAETDAPERLALAVEARPSLRAL